MPNNIEPQYATALDDGLTIPTPGANRGAGRVLSRGDEIALTEAFIDATRDRHGDTPWPGIVTDERAQIEKFGRICLVPGRLAENPDLLSAINREKEAAALAEAQRDLIEARRWGGRVRVVTVPVAVKGDADA